MKNRLIFLCALLLCFALPASAERVTDMAELFTEAEEAELEATIAQITEKYDFDVAIVSTNDSEGKSANIYAADFFEAQGYGYGPEGDGILFAFCLDIGKYFTDTHGYGIAAFTDRGLDELHELMTPDIKSKAYFDAMKLFLHYIPQFLDQAAQGTPYDVNHPLITYTPWQVAGRYLFIPVIAGFIIALIVVLAMRAKLLRAEKQSAAEGYVRDGSVRVDQALDLFLYRTQTRRKIERESSGGKGGSSTFSSSSGGTHGGRGGSL